MQTSRRSYDDDDFHKTFEKIKRKKKMNHKNKKRLDKKQIFRKYRKQKYERLEND